ncbi:O-antigen polysaccharide polymerase Wzy [uncultured Chryseobacterium sp.]|uniref:O-antigen polysaccharide polymerase Wzy n=2 Tax=uncultured Chryseobacterium sp. TaxID=259322 RepID=UPI0025DB2CB9|nr:O-antigen polysaccharide polymerase Wzy [uncultured Chryseobacterium sp.]
MLFLLIDLLLIITLLILMRVSKTLRFMNPCFIFIFFHLIFISYRCYQIIVQDSLIISNQFYLKPVSVEEIENFLIISDVTLLGFFIGYYIKYFLFIPKKRKNEIHKIRIENRKIIKYFTIIVFICGIFSLVLFATIPGVVDNKDLERNTFIVMFSNLGIVAVIILVYQYGFKKLYLIIFFFIIILYAAQGENRYRVILPLIFILLLYLKKHNLKFPPIKFILAGFVIALLTLPLKSIGSDLRNNQNVDLVESFIKSFDEFSTGKSGDLSFVEQGAAMVSNINERGKYFLGRTYFPILIFWIPRSMYQEKPRLNEWQFEISDKNRNFGEMGQISLISGEAYANFGLFGAFVIPFFLGWFYAKLYLNQMYQSYLSRKFLLYAIFTMILFQVWRDGIISLILFPILNFSPLFILYFLKKDKHN